MQDSHIVANTNCNVAIILETGSENFDKFLNLLGDTICLQGWAGYRGGLDTKSNLPTLHTNTYILKTILKSIFILS